MKTWFGCLLLALAFFAWEHQKMTGETLKLGAVLDSIQEAVR
jgi:hypothetical protein